MVTSIETETAIEREIKTAVEIGIDMAQNKYEYD